MSKPKSEEVLSDIKTEWQAYTEFLQKKYPPWGDQKWEFTCEYHKRIDEILKKV